MSNLLTINGEYGEGGGQILRTALSLSAILGQPIHLVNIRGNRKKPGLAAQHLTAVRATALICEAEVQGAALGSTELIFAPQAQPIPGLYAFDVAEVSEHGSAGATSLVLQTLLLPLALAPAASEIIIRGGTHVPWSPNFHYIQNTFLPMMSQLGVQATTSLTAWGWYPAGEGEINLHISGQAKLPKGPIQTLWPERGRLRQIKGWAIAASLPAHIAQRMRNQATKRLAELDLPSEIEPRRVRSNSPGAGLFLKADYELSQAGFSTLGKIGKRSEQVADETIDDLMQFHQSEAILDPHLTDQLIVPITLSGLVGPLSVAELSSHTKTNLWVVEQFLGQVATLDHHTNRIEFITRDDILR